MFLFSNLEKIAQFDGAHLNLIKLPDPRDSGVAAAIGVVARDRLVKLWHGRLDEHLAKGAAVGIFGMGGMGKTTVAKALCDEYEQCGWRTFVVAFDLRPSATEAVSSFQKSSLKALEPTLNVEGWTTEQVSYGVRH